MDDERKALLERRDRLPRAVTSYAIRHPLLVVAIWLLASIISIAGVLRIDIETSTDSVLDRDSEEWSFYRSSQDRFGGDEIIAIVFDSPTPYDVGLLEKVRDFTREFEELPNVWRVDSLATLPLIHLDESGGISLSPAIRGAVPTADSEYRDLVSRIDSDPIAPNSVVSRDGHSLAVNVVLEPNSEQAYWPILHAIRERLNDQNAWISGVPIFRVETDRWTKREILIFVPLTIALIFCLSWTLLRDWRIACIPVGTAGLGTVIVLGAMGATQVPLTISTMILPSILLALGCAYTMHPITAAMSVPTVAERNERVVGVAMPISLSGLTTALGFVSLTFVGIPTIRDVGAFGALGVVVLLAETLTLVPAVMSFVDFGSRRFSFRFAMRTFLAGRVIPGIADHRVVVCAAWVLFSILIGCGAVRLHVQTDVIEWFPPKDEIRTDYEAIRTRMSGISPMNVVLQASEPLVMTSPEVLSKVHELERFIASQTEVGKVVSLATPIIQMATTVSPSTKKLVPSSRSEIEQYLLILESDPYLRDLVSGDRTSSNILIRVNENGSDILIELASRISGWWSANGLAGVSARPTGIMYEFARAEQEIATGQIRGLVFVLVTVGLIVVLAFRQLDVALVAIVPNVLPILMGFGVMGLLNISLDAGTVVVGSIAFGIAVDDTIHAVTEYLRMETRAQTVGSRLRMTYEKVLPPVIFTTLVISLGFLVLGASRFLLIRNLGVVTSIVMVLCLLADVLLLPALLSYVDSQRNGGPAVTENS